MEKNLKKLSTQARTAAYGEIVRDALMGELKTVTTYREQFKTFITKNAFDILVKSILEGAPISVHEFIELICKDRAAGRVVIEPEIEEPVVTESIIETSDTQEEKQEEDNNIDVSTRKTLLNNLQIAAEILYSTIRDFCKNELIYHNK